MRGRGAESLEAKIIQHLTPISEEGIYTIFMDLYKEYDPMDRDRCLEILNC